MQVEMSLAELLINAIAHGKVPGVQFKRGWSDDRAAFDGLKAVIGSRLDGARRVAVESELRRLHDESPPFKLRTALRNLLAAARRVPIVKRADVEPFSTCLGCERTDGDPCKPGCWVFDLDISIGRAAELLTPSHPIGGDT